MSHPGDLLCVALLVAEMAQMSSFPKLPSVFGSIFWNRELWKLEMWNGSRGFTEQWSLLYG